MNPRPEPFVGEPLDRRELWRPDRNEQMAAIEILLASSIPQELRRALREREAELARKELA